MIPMPRTKSSNADRGIDTRSATKLRKLIQALGEPAVQAALVRLWARWNDLSLVGLPAGSVTEEILTHREAGTAGLEDALAFMAPYRSIKDLEGVFEILIDSQRRKSQGAIYTPDYIIDYLVEQALERSGAAHRPSLRLCDPACGSGGFLIRASGILSKELGISPAAVFERHLVGFDNDPEAIKSARCLIELHLLSQGCMIDGRTTRIFEVDTLLDGGEALRDRAGAPEGFDVVCTNPPYVKIQNLPIAYREALASKFDGMAEGSFSLAPLFLKAGFDLLSENGCLAVITQNNLYTSLAGKPIRAFLQREKCVSRIIDFGHQQVFHNASAYTCLVFIDKRSNAHLAFGSIRTRPTKAVLEAAELSLIETAELKAEKWRLAARKHLENLAKIEAIGAPLGQVAKIKVGFATLKDAVFLVKGNQDGTTASSLDGACTSIELGATRSAVKISELESDADLPHNQTRIIFPYEKQNGRFVLIPEDELSRRFPGAYAYLRAHQALLETRDKGRKDYGAWYGWGRTQGMEAPGPKLLTKTFSKRPQFFLDASDQLFCNGYSVKPTPGLFSPSLTLEVLAQILNSRLMDYYAKLTSFQIEGDYQCYQKNFIEKFGIPNLSAAQCIRLAALEGQARDGYLAELYGVRMDDILEIAAAP